MNVDRVELKSVDTTLVEHPTKKIRLPRWLLNPVFATRLTLATIAGLGSSVTGDLVGSTSPVIFAAQGIVDKDSFSVRTLSEETKYLRDWKTQTFDPPKLAILESPLDEDIRGDSLEVTIKVINKYLSQPEEGTDKWWNELGKFLTISVPSVISVGILFDLINKRRLKKAKPSKTNLNGNRQEDNPLSQIEELQSQLKNSTINNISLRARNKVLEKQAGESQDLKQAADGLSAKVSSLTQENTNLAFSNNALVDQTKRLQTEVDNTAQENTGLKSSNNQILGQVKSLEGQIGQLNNDYSKLQQSKITTDELAERYRQQYLESSSQVNKVTQERDDLKSSNSLLQNQVDGLKKDVEKLNSDLEKAQKEKAKSRPAFNPEWKVGQEGFERRWQDKNLPLGDDFNSVLNRFEGMMDIVHETSLDDKTMDVSKMSVRVRAGLEFVIPKVWVDGLCQKFFKKLYDKNFRTGFAQLPDDEEIARIIYIPRQYRTLISLNQDQIKDVKKIHNILHFALHPDRDRNYRKDRNWDLEKSISTLHNILNPAWDEIKI